MKGTEEKIVAWLKYKELHGIPTIISVASADDEQAFPVYRFMDIRSCNCGHYEQAIHHLNCEIKALTIRLDESKELLHKTYRDLNQLNSQELVDAIGDYLNECDK